MSPPGTVRSATRRFVGLTALRWLPVGLTVPVMVLLAAPASTRTAFFSVAALVLLSALLCLRLPRVPVRDGPCAVTGPGIPASRAASRRAPPARRPPAR